VVNCAACISRSVAVTLAHLNEPPERGGEGWSLQHALRTVRAARSRAGPNLGFVCALMRREVAVRGEGSVPPECLLQHPWPHFFCQSGGKVELGRAAVCEGLRLFRGEAPEPFGAETAMADERL
jgi:hypothetical protein